MSPLRPPKLSRLRAILGRRSVRLRLTLLYGGLFLACGALLLTFTYLFVDRSGGAIAVAARGVDGTAFSIGSAIQSGPVPANGFGAPPDQALLTQFREVAVQQHQAELRTLLTTSAIALGLMTVLSLALGWVVAGRVLSPLRTITAAARKISASNLNARLALAGPQDEIKELGDTFDALLARLEASFDAQRRFIANASHELRTPLARQRALAQVALADPEATLESLRTAHERVLASGVQQEHLIDALLALARGQAGPQRREPLDLAAVTGQVLAARQGELQQRGLTVRATLDPAPLVGDPRLIERLVGNLADNAIRYNAPEGRIEVGTGRAAGRAVLIVVNTGQLVPEEAVEQLFQPFRRLGTERTGHGDGVGLGLSIVRAIADAHGGTVGARARPTGGLRLEVSFPPGAPPGRRG